MPFYPLFYRDSSGAISFPQIGEGWYWLPEYRLAAKYPGELEVIEWYHFKPECDHNPFIWIGEYYSTRQQWIQNPTEEWQSGGEKIIKLGLNSLYGKTAQQVGGSQGKPPTYFQMEWAGFITSSCRAALGELALLNPKKVISFATDGMLSLAEHECYRPKEKILGAWEYKAIDGMIMVMPGVYYLDTNTDKVTHHSRGMDKRDMESPAQILDGWKNKLETLPVKSTRLLGLGTCAISNRFWEHRGQFINGVRNLQLFSPSPNKRQPIDHEMSSPHKKLYDTGVAWNYEYCGMSNDRGDWPMTISAPYKIKFEPAPDPNLEEDATDLEMWQEEIDCQNV